MTPSPTKAELPLPTKLDYIDGKTLIHIESAIDDPVGAGIPVCSIPKSKEALAAELVRRYNQYEEMVKALSRLADAGPQLGGLDAIWAERNYNEALKQTSRHPRHP